MNLNFKILPINNMPYTDEMAMTRLMVRIFENIPCLAMLPNIDKSENLIDRTLTSFAGLKKTDSKYTKVSLSDKDVSEIENAVSSLNLDILENFKVQSVFLKKYLQIVERIKPKQTLISLYGIFSTILFLEKNGYVDILKDKKTRKLLILYYIAQALWCILKVKSISPNTTPIILYDEPELYKFSQVKRSDTKIQNSTLITIFTKVFEQIHQNGGLVGIQSFSKCDWNIPLDSGIDIISFDAHNNPYNLHVVAKELNLFLHNGGIINWAIIPANNDENIKNQTVDNILKKTSKAIEMLTAEGVDIQLTYNNSVISIVNSLEKLPIFFAEKALMIAYQASKRMPVFKENPQ